MILKQQWLLVLTGICIGFSIAKFFLPIFLNHSNKTQNNPITATEKTEEIIQPVATISDNAVSDSTPQESIIQEPQKLTVIIEENPQSEDQSESETEVDTKKEEENSEFLSDNQYEEQPSEQADQMPLSANAPHIKLAQKIIINLGHQPQDDALDQLYTLSFQQQQKALHQILNMFFSSRDRTPLHTLLQVCAPMTKVKKRYKRFFYIIHHYNRDLVDIVLDLRNCKESELPFRVNSFTKEARSKVNVSLFKSVRDMAQECLEDHYRYLYYKVR